MLHKEVHSRFQDTLKVRRLCWTLKNNERLPGQTARIFGHVQIIAPDTDDCSAPESQFVDVPTIRT